VTSKRYQRIILHAGLHKTGTTSVQENCFRHRDVLLQHGIVYPVFHFRERRIINHSDPLAAVVSSRSKAYGMVRRMNVEDDPSVAIKAFSEQLDALLTRPQGKTLVLSAEMVADLTPKDLAALKKRLVHSTDRLHVIAYVRSPQSSLASMLQQRALAGFADKPQDLTEVVRNRFERLRKTFPNLLEPYNFHDAVKQPNGLLGHFLELAGLPQDVIESLEFSHANSRMSAEAYRLIEAVNLAFPPGGEERHGVKRFYHDMRPLQTLPGQPFRIDASQDPDLAAQLARESEWLQRELGWTFPAPPAQASGELWQLPSLLALETAISKLEDSALRHCATEALESQAQALETANPANAAVLRFIAAKLQQHGDCPADLALEKLGADHFKFAALQFERASPETAYYLMTLARQLRPDAPFIEERVQHYRNKLTEGGSA
jgi:hypothetical protein